MADRGDRPIADYAIVGDCHGAALVAKDGSVDWCALERFDADPLFLRILDARRGGFLAIRPRGDFTSTRTAAMSVPRFAPKIEMSEPGAIGPVKLAPLTIPPVAMAGAAPNDTLRMR